VVGYEISSLSGLGLRLDLKKLPYNKAPDDFVEDFCQNTIQRTAE